MLHMIYNPQSQSGRGRLYAILLHKKLKKAGIPVRSHRTKYRGHATDLVKTMDIGADDTILLLGGDGSLNELLGGISMPIAPAIRLHPVGSGNDFIRGLGQNTSDDELIRVLKGHLGLSEDKQAVTMLDVGCSEVTFADGSVASHPFGVSIGFGFDANTCLSIDRSSWKKRFNKYKIGKIIYTFIGVTEIFKYDIVKDENGHKTKRPVTLTVSTDGSEPVTYNNVVFMSCHNTPFEGGGFRFAPRANPSDGLLDVCIVTAGSHFKAVCTLVCSLFGGRHTICKNVHMIRCSSLSVQSEHPVVMHTDGEYTENAVSAVIGINKGQMPYLL